MYRITASLALLLFSTSALAATDRLTQTNFIANKKAYHAQITDKNFINGWGIAIRPKGAGGHFWVTAKDQSYQFVGDVKASSDKALQVMHTDRLATIKLPVGGDDQFATGVAFSGSKDHFVITQKVEGADDITAPAKFLFSSDGGIISAWTERKKDGGEFDWPMEAISVIDESANGTQFFGLAVSHDYDTLYAADFGAQPSIKTYDGEFKPADIQFDQPFDDNKNGKVDAGEYAPFNVQVLGDKVYVAYAKTSACPKKESKSGACKAGEIWAGEEDISKDGHGRVAIFSEEGKLEAVLKDAGKLSAPWGFAIAPANFGAYSNMLLVSNFGSGTIAAYDPASLDFKGFLKNAKGKTLVIDKIWGILFGNGESLGDSNALYFAAGPKDEVDGVFGVLRIQK